MSTDYYIHDNGGVSFWVSDYPDQKRCSIWAFDSVANDEIQAVEGPDAEIYPFRRIMTINYLQLWPGVDTRDERAKDTFIDDPPEDGNTLLLQIGESDYLFMQRDIDHFHICPDEVVEEFLSPISDNDIPYTCVITDKAYIFTNENYAYTREEFEDPKLVAQWPDIFTRFYKHFYDNSLPYYVGKVYNTRRYAYSHVPPRMLLNERLSLLPGVRYEKNSGPFFRKSRKEVMGD